MGSVVLFIAIYLELVASMVTVTKEEKYRRHIGRKLALSESDITHALITFCW